MIYLLIIISCIFLCILEEESPELKIGSLKIKLGYISSCLIILFFSCFRSMELGKDIYFYKIHFYKFLEEPIRIYEPGYTLLQMFVQKISTNFQFFMAVCSLLTLIPIFYVIKKNVYRYYWLSVSIIIITFYIQSFSILRASLGVAFIFMAYDAIEVRKESLFFPLKYWIYIILAISMHYSMIYFLIIFYLSSKKLKCQHYLTTGMLAFFLLLPCVPSVITRLIAAIRNRYTGYITNGKFDISLVPLIFFTIFVFLGIIYKKKVKYDLKIKVLFDLMWFSWLFTICCSWFPAYSRVLQMVLPFSALYLPNIIQGEQKCSVQKICVFLILVMFFLYWGFNSTFQYQFM